MYGLVKEDINQELLKYGNDYIDNHSCDEIYNDLTKFQSAVNSGNPEMTIEDKKELDDNLKQMNTFKGLACGKVKKEMKKTFSKQSHEEPEKLKKYMCWFASNITNTNLNSCKQTETIQKQQDNTDSIPKIDTPNIQKTIPITKPKTQTTQTRKNKSSAESALDNYQNSDNEADKSLKYFQ